MKKMIIATGNKNKIREMKQIMDGLGYEIVSMKDEGIDPEIIENGTTFAENALIKARAVNKISHSLVLADDSGLEIDALNKEPGIYSARYMGEDTSYDLKNQNLIDRLDGVPDEERTARFVCAVAAVFPDGTEKTVVRTMEGRIGYKIAGENGFGYDPIFVLPEYGKTSAEISPEEKNAISHRGKAMREMYKIVKDYVD